MERIFTCFICIFLLWMPRCESIKCYDQQCTKRESGWECYYANEGIVREYEEPWVCREQESKKNGEITMYHRGNDWPDDKLLENYKNGKDACWNADGIGEGEGKHEKIICICNKDFCNTKFKLPPDAKVMD